MASLANDTLEGELEEEEEGTSGGYELEFLEKVPVFSICPICTSVARNPLQSTCCGKIFCSSCLIALNNSERSYERHRTCPHCRKEPMGHCYPDRNSERLIMDLTVKCENHERGCEWTGELRNLKAHRQSCIHAFVPCPNQCGERLLRQKIPEHATKTCKKREYTCKDCGLQDTYSYITNEHFFLCPDAIIMCTHDDCWAKFKRSEKLEHAAVCPKMIITCPYMTVGCTACVKREELEDHKRNNLEQHLSMAVQKMNELDQVMYGQQRELQRLGRHSNIVIRMGNFSEVENSHDWWYSPHFYTSSCGYTLSISAAMVGEYLSVYLCLVRGEYDDILTWPMRGTFIITLLNQLENNLHHSATLNFDSADPTQSNMRVLAGRGRGYGFPYFIARPQLRCGLSPNCQYLRDNALYFSITAVNMSSADERKWLSSPITFMYR